MTIAMIVLARFIEAYRDAEAFERPVEARSFLWHLLKFPQFSFWVAAGYFLDNFWFIGLGVLVAWPVFEMSLRTFRRLL